MVKEEMHLPENTLFDLDLQVRSRSHQMFPSAFYIMWAMHLQSLCYY